MAIERLDLRRFESTRPICGFCYAKQRRGAFYKKDGTEVNVRGKLDLAHAAGKTWHPAFVSKFLSRLRFLCNDCGPALSPEQRAQIKIPNRRDIPGKPRAKQSSASTPDGKSRAVRRQAAATINPEQRAQLWALATEYDRLNSVQKETAAAQLDSLLDFYNQSIEKETSPIRETYPWFGARWKR